MTVGTKILNSVSLNEEAGGEPIRGDRLRTKPASEKLTLPPIPVKDRFGRVLDIDTTYQRNIGQARWTVANRNKETELGPEEWRLPHAPTPARPDYSRLAPPKVTKQEVLKKVQGLRKRSNSLPDLLDGVEGSLRKEYKYLSSSLEKLHTLPPLTAAALFHQAFSDLLPHREYISIAQAITLHHLASKKSIDDSYLNSFPGFSYGQRRAGLCYGCEKGPGPHIHEDRPVRTGGGFTYYRRDIPAGPDFRKHPLHWKVDFKTPETYLTKGARLPPLDVTTQHLSPTHAWQIKVPHGLLPNPFLQGEDEDLDSGRGYSMIDGQDIYKSDADDSTPWNVPRQAMNYLPALVEGESGLRKGQKLRALVDIPAVDYSMGVEGIIPRLGDSSMMPLTFVGEARKPGFGTLRKGSLSTGEHLASNDDTSINISQGIYGNAAPSLEINKQLSPIRRKMEDEQLVHSSTDDEEEEEEEEEGEEEDGLDPGQTTETRKKIYKVPKAFQIQKYKKRQTISRSPFSTNREYTISKSAGFQVKKSDKEVTQFVDFERPDEVLWQEPKRFELEEREKVPIKPWVRPRTPEKRISSPIQDDNGEGIRPPSSQDSGVEDAFTGRDNEDNEGLVPREPTPPPPTPPKVENESLPSPPQPPPPKRGQQKRRVIEVRRKSSVKEPEVKKEEPKPVTPSPSPTPTPESPVQEEVEEEDYVRIEDDDDTEYDRLELPPLPSAKPPEPPSLPQWDEPVVSTREISSTTLEVPPPMQEPPPQRLPVTAQRKKKKVPTATLR